MNLILPKVVKHYGANELFMNTLLLQMCSLGQESELAALYFYIKINCIVHKW